jgi:hypothetical protein
LKNSPPFDACPSQKYSLNYASYVIAARKLWIILRPIGIIFFFALEVVLVEVTIFLIHWQ